MKQCIARKIMIVKKGYTDKESDLNHLKRAQEKKKAVKVNTRLKNKQVKVMREKLRSSEESMRSATLVDRRHCLEDVKN